MKRGWRIVLIVAVCGVVAVVTALVWPGEKEPVYKGKKLSEWIDGAQTSEVYIFKPGRMEREEAVKQIGANAVPYLLKRIREAEYPQQPRLQVLLTRTIPRAGTTGRHIQLRKWLRAVDAAWAFQFLPKGARSAIPELRTLSGSTNSFVRADRKSVVDGFMNSPHYNRKG